MNNWLLCFLFFCSCLLGDETLRVQLSTQEKFTPLYLNTWESTRSFSTSYLQQLRNVLEFDLAHSGFSKVLPIDEKIEKTLAVADHNLAFQPKYYKNAHFVLKGVIEEKALTLFVFFTKTGKLKQFPSIPLSGDLSSDRRQIHKLSDAIVSLLFHVQGIANSRILYSLQVNPNDQKWRAEIWECDWDGANARQVTQEESYAITPVSIPTTNHFLYVCYKNGQPKIYSSTKIGKGQRFVDLRGNQLLPAISPKKDKVAFICDAAGRADLFLQPLRSNGSLEGKPFQLFSYPHSTQASPTFSPDGTHIAFVSDKDGSPRIYLISTEASSKRSQPKLLTKINRENTCPSWSPDGTKLAYSAKTNGIRQIWMYDFVSEKEEPLTSGPGNKENPVWAADNLHVFFNSTDPSSSELYMIDLNQKEAVKISQGQGKKHYPTWGRRL